jgi:hypothetical protein
VEKPEAALSEFSGEPIRTDNDVERFGIQLSSRQVTDIKHLDRNVTIMSGDEEVQLTPEAILGKGSVPIFTKPIGFSAAELAQQNGDLFVVFDKHPRFFISPQQTTRQLDLGWENQANHKIVMGKLQQMDNQWKFTVNESLSQPDIDSLSMLLAPDKKHFPYDPSNSTLYWNNINAIANRSAVRLYVDPRNKFNRPISLSSFEVKVDSRITFDMPPLERHIGPFFVDFTASESAQSTVRLVLDGNLLLDEVQVKFYANCAREWLTCLKDPNELIGFTKVILVDKRQEYERRIEEFKKSLRHRLGQFTNFLN